MQPIMRIVDVFAISLEAITIAVRGKCWPKGRLLPETQIGLNVFDKPRGIRTKGGSAWPVFSFMIAVKAEGDEHLVPLEKLRSHSSKRLQGVEATRGCTRPHSEIRPHFPWKRSLIFFCVFCHR
jgi:hypothetical protein